MAELSPQEIIQQSLRERKQREQQPAQSAETAQPQGGPLGVVAAVGERLSQDIPALTEGAGATVGFGAGAALTRNPRAAAALGAAGGAAGAVAGNLIGQQFVGGEPGEGELLAAAAWGAAPAVLMQGARGLSRLLTGIPTIRKSKMGQRLRLGDAEARLTESAPRRFIGSHVRRSERMYLDMNMELERLKGLTPLEIAEEFGTPEKVSEFILHTTLDQTERAVQLLTNIVPKHLRTAMLNPEVAVTVQAGSVARRRLAKQEIIGGIKDTIREQAIRGTAAATGATAGLVAADQINNESMAALTSGFGGGALVGWMMGQLSIDKANSLLMNPKFRRWAANIAPHNPLAAAATAFATQVMLVAKDQTELAAAQGMFDKMVEVINSAPEFALGLAGQGEQEKGRISFSSEQQRILSQPRKGAAQ